MEHYRNFSGKSGVIAYEIGGDFIKVQFKDGHVYLYNYASTGGQNVEMMKSLAIAGSGLNSFIGRVVKKNFASKS